MSQQQYAPAKKPSQSTTSSSSGLQQQKRDKCRKKKPLLQRSAVGPASESVPPIVHEVLRSPGQPLDAATRTFMEPRFGHDFGKVRVHSDTRASESAKAVNAQAYTVGSDLVFDPSFYRPGTDVGKSLLAHELTHVVQQRNLSYPDIQSNLALGPIHSPFEQDANEYARNIAGGGKTARALTAVRQPEIQRGAVGSFFSDLFSLSPGPFNAIYRLFGGENYSHEELQDYLNKLNKTGNIEDNYDSDNKARALIARSKEFQPLTLDLKVLLIKEMLEGATLGADEKAILTLLRTAPDAERTGIVNKIGRDRLWGDFSGANRRALEAITLKENEFSDPKLVERLKALDPDDLAEYRDNALDSAVKAKIEDILKMQKITTPLGLGAIFDKSGAAHSTINGAEVIVKPDEVSNSSEKFALTSIEGSYGKIDNIMASEDKIVSFDGPGQASFTIKTTYPSESYSSGQEGYGRGTTIEDISAGQTTVKFHESRHGLDYLEFIKNNAPPTFKGSVGMSVKDFEKAEDDYQKDTKDYSDKISEYSILKTDCAGKPITSEALQRVGVRATICKDLAKPH